MNKTTDETIVGLTISNNNRYIATSHGDLKIRIWELETGDLFITLLEVIQILIIILDLVL